MRLILAAAILAQSASTPSFVERNQGVDSNRQERHRRVQSLLLRKGTSDIRVDEISGTQTWLSQRGHHGQLKNLTIESSFTECEPLDGDPDIGILACSYNEHCVESDASSLGGFCISYEHDGRLLKQVLPSNVCDPSYTGTKFQNCNCSNFDVTTNTGAFSCQIYDYYCFLPKYCGALVIYRTILPNGQESSNYCYQIVTPSSVDICYGINSTPECYLSVNGTTCSSCEIVNVAQLNATGCYQFDCTNTIANFSGNDCKNEFLIQGVFPHAFHTPSPSPPPAVFVCDICPNGEYITQPGVVVQIPTLNPLTCAQIDTAAKNGTILQSQCPLLKPFVQGPCGCAVPGVPSSSPSKIPTRRPTPAPVTAPTQPPVPSPTNAPVTAPTQPPVPSPTNAPVTAPTQPPVPSPTNAPVTAPTTQAPVSNPTMPIVPTGPVYPPRIPTLSPVQMSMSMGLAEGSRRDLEELNDAFDNEFGRRD